VYAEKKLPLPKPRTKGGLPVAGGGGVQEEVEKERLAEKESAEADRDAEGFPSMEGVASWEEGEGVG